MPTLILTEDEMFVLKTALTGYSKKLPADPSGNKMRGEVLAIHNKIDDPDAPRIMEIVSDYLWLNGRIQRHGFENCQDDVERIDAQANKALVYAGLRFRVVTTDGTNFWNEQFVCEDGLADLNTEAELATAGNVWWIRQDVPVKSE